MIYMFTIIALILISVLLLRIRLKIQLDDDIKTVFLGLGRTGLFYDILKKQSNLLILGTYKREFVSEKQKQPTTNQMKPTKKKTKREIPFGEILDIVINSSKACYTYSVSLLKSVIIEELQGEVSGGFDSPDKTGQLFGYYQAVYSAVPSVVGRLQYYPNWTEASFDANLKASVAIPLYKIVYRSIILFFSLPLRDILKITIGRKERSHDG